MGLHSSELDINKSDSENLSSSLPTPEFKTDSGSENGGETEWPESMPGDENEGGNMEELAASPIKGETQSEPPKFSMSRAELRRMQEALEMQPGDAEHPNHMDLRIGRIIYISPHEPLDMLYYSEIDLGDYDESRLVGTTLLEHYPNYMELEGQTVVILCNVNPLDDRDIRSKTGMLLLATKTKFDEEGKEIGEYAELVQPWFCDEVGARIYVEGFPRTNPLPTMDEEFFDFVMKDFTVDSTGQVVWRGLPLKIENHPLSKLTVKSLTDTYCKLD